MHFRADFALRAEPALYTPKKSPTPFRLMRSQMHECGNALTVRCEPKSPQTTAQW